MKKIILSVLALIIALMSTVVAVFGWLAAGTSVPLEKDLSGAVLSNYFASGDGKKDNAFIINRPNHLYNLAWLQNNGEFNKIDESGNLIQQYYFKITADLDMSGYVLPPIGTKENPFIGNLDGGNNTVYNITVSNVKKDNDDKPYEVSPVPTSVNDNAIGGGYTDIVGFFGVIGHYPGATTCPNNVSVSNLYLDNLTVRTRTSNTLIGLFAGYVCGNVSNIGVYRSMVSIGSGVNTLGAINDDISFSNHSNYALIGAYDEKTTGWADTETSSGGAGAGFGSSIDMQLLSRRINYMSSRMLNTANVTPASYSYQVNENTAYNNNYIAKYTSVGTNFNLNARNYISNAKDSEFYWKSLGTSQYIQSDLLRHTFLPLNVDLSAMGLDSSDEITFGSSETPASFHINSEYLAATSETVSANNTGYIVGGAQAETSLAAYTQLKVQLLARNDGYTIYKSLGCDYNSVAYDKNKLVLISTDSNGNFGWIEDSYNSSTYKDNTSALKVDYTTAISSGSFERYDAVIDQFHTLLSSLDYISGLYFSQPINLSNITTGSGVKLNGTTYSSYQFLDSSINFSLNQSGYMTAIIGTYYSYSSNTTTYRSGISLYHVVRDDKNEIVTDTSQTNYTREITSVWQNANGDIKYKYGATAVDNTAPETGYTKVYDKYWYSGTLNRSTAYYVEIPLVSGDYAIGAMVAQVSDYLLYLDIGANGAEGGSGSGETETTYKIETVRFVYLLSDTYASLEDLFTFEIVRTSTTNGVQIYFLMTSSKMCYYVTIDTENTQVNLTDTSLSEKIDNSTDLSGDYGGTKKDPS